jgi:hypothetical protein
MLAALAVLKKLILLSLIIASIAIPARAARAKNPRQGLRKMIIQMAVFDLIYLILITVVWVRM